MTIEEHELEWKLLKAHAEGAMKLLGALDLEQPQLAVARAHVFTQLEVTGEAFAAHERWMLQEKGVHHAKLQGLYDAFWEWAVAAVHAVRV